MTNTSVIFSIVLVWVGPQGSAWIWRFIGGIIPDVLISQRFDDLKSDIVRCPVFQGITE